MYRCSVDGHTDLISSLPTHAVSEFLRYQLDKKGNLHSIKSTHAMRPLKPPSHRATEAIQKDLRSYAITRAWDHETSAIILVWAMGDRQG
jgi:hypothetical protein